jgi:hypothetical protein
MWSLFYFLTIGASGQEILSNNVKVDPFSELAQDVARGGDVGPP